MAHKPRAAAANPAPNAARHAAPKPGKVDSTSIRVRMYRLGLGDCFLISLLPPRRDPFHLMIDCGVILGTPGAKGRLAVVLDDIIMVTGGKVDVLAVTHEHYDHVAGFVLCAEKFAAAGERQAGKLSVAEVWFAWTETPGDEFADRLRKQRHDRKEALAGLLDRVQSMGVSGGEVESVTDLLRFFGVDQAGQDRDAGASFGSTAQAMLNARTFASTVTYWEPGKVWQSDAAPGLRIYGLGPPRDEKVLRKTDSTSEVYHLGSQHFDDSVRMAAALSAESDGGDFYAPFDHGYRRSLSVLMSGGDSSDTATFLQENYLGAGTKTPETDISWRKIDGDWLDSAEQLALALDNATNNTSLVLAIELVESRRVLLFPADAQVGNWLSWHTLSCIDGDEAVEATDLLTRTVFYKVGHHGSHNATLKARGLELMPATGLVAFIPVDESMAKVKRWFEMPLPHLLDALKARCGEAVIRTDAEAPPGIEGLTSGGTGGPFPTLYHEWTQDL